MEYDGPVNSEVVDEVVDNSDMIDCGEVGESSIISNPMVGLGSTDKYWTRIVGWKIRVRKVSYSYFFPSLQFFEPSSGSYHKRRPNSSF